MMCARSWVKDELSKSEPDMKLADLESVFSALAVENEVGADEDGNACVSGCLYLFMIFYHTVIMLVY
ncbi:hypothetical protein LINPERPRIM_LOCUS31754 [Linum perenne]